MVGIRTPLHCLVAVSFVLGLLVACEGSPGASPTFSPNPSNPPALAALFTEGEGENGPESPPPELPSVPPSEVGPGVTGLWFPPGNFAAFNLSQSGSTVTGELIVDEHGSTCGDLSASVNGNTLTLTLVLTPANCPREGYHAQFIFTGQVQGDVFTGELVITAEGYYETERVMLTRRTQRN